MRSDRDIECVILIFQLIKRDLFTDVGVGMYLDANGEDRTDLLIQHFAWKTIGRDAIAQHTAELPAFFIDRNLMTHERKVIRCGKSARTTADNSNTLSGRFRTFRVGNNACMVDRIALETADVDRVVDHVAAAARLARMLADIGAGRGERIVLADELHGVGVAAILDQY